MLGLSSKTKYFQLQHIPMRSTLSDANKGTDAYVFGSIYHKLLRKFGHQLSESRIKDVVNKQVEILDSTTISLFKDILRSADHNLVNERKRSVVKVLTVITVDKTIPPILWFTEAAKNDHFLLEKLKPIPCTIYVFGKGYNDYRALKRFGDAQTNFVNRIKDNAVCRIMKNINQY